MKESWRHHGLLSEGAFGHAPSPLLEGTGGGMLCMNYFCLEASAYKAAMCR